MMPRPRSLQHGAAALIVVMVLFFIASMVAAYTSRNMIFEQRTGTNLYRATQALEAAEAGMDWAMTMLNQARIDEECVASAALTDNSFRDRYLSINAVSGRVAAKARSNGMELTPTCVFDPATGRWVCSCPVDGPPDVDAPSTGPAPAFRVRFRPPTTGQEVGIVRVDVVGCTRLDDDCLRMNNDGVVNEGRVMVSTMAFLTGRSLALPKAAVTARGNVLASGLSVSNVRVEDGGITVHASGTINPSLALTTLAGNALAGSTVSADTFLDLPAIGSLNSQDRFFAGLFQLTPARWRQQPAYVEIDCGLGSCTAEQVREAQAELPGRPIWLQGDLDVDSSGPIGTATAPVTLIVNGQIAFSTAGVTIHGLVVVRPPDPVSGWTVSGSGSVRGALVVDGSVNGSGSLNVAYDGDVLRALRATHGSFIRAPGTWRDWRAQ